MQIKTPTFYKSIVQCIVLLSTLNTYALGFQNHKYQIYNLIAQASIKDEYYVSIYVFYKKILLLYSHSISFA